MVTSGAVRRPRWPGWRHLPRDTRDTFFLLMVIGWTALPHLLRLPLWCAVLTAGVLAWRAQLALSSEALPGRFVLACVLLLTAGLTQWSFGTLLGREAGVALLLILMALKMLELRARRDAFVVFFLGFFLVLTHFLYSQSLPVAVAMLASVWGLLTALVLAHMPVGRPALWQAARVSLRTVALGAPVMVLLFLMFPRIGPLWGVPQDGRASTGLSASMSMGSIAEVVQDDRIALRLKFIDPPPPPEALYFRGPVLSAFDGNEWTPSSTEFPAALQPDPLRASGRPVRYEITIEPTQLPLLPLLDATPALPPVEGVQARRRADLSWATQRPVNQRVRIETVAYPDFSLGPLVAESSLNAHLRLPVGFNPRLLAWATALRQRPELRDAGAGDLAGAVLHHIRTGGFSYTLSPGLYGDANPRAALDEFWLDRRAGFCEHFAAGFVVAMRALGVPARVVTGFQGADSEVQDGYVVVRRSYAHAWAEYWQTGRGWVRADPTAAVAPERIERGLALRSPRGAVASALDNVDPRLLASWRGLWESIDNRWNQWVLNYTRGQQLDLLKRLGFEAPDWRDLARLLIATLSAVSLLGAAWAAWERQRQDPWQRQAQRLRRSLRGLGLAAAGHETPRAWAAQIERRFGIERGAALAGLLLDLERQRYGRVTTSLPSRPSQAWWRSVKAEVRRLRPLGAGC